MFKCLDGVYINHLHSFIAHHDDGVLKEHYKLCVIKTYFLNVVGTTIFVDKSATYTDDILEIFHIYKQYSQVLLGVTCLVHLYTELDKRKHLFVETSVSKDKRG